MKRVNSIDVMRSTNKMADLEDHVAIRSILCLCFCFLSLYSRPRQPLFLLMPTTHVSKAVLSNMMIISHGLKSSVFSIAIEWIVLESGYIRATSDGLGKRKLMLTPEAIFRSLCRCNLPRRTTNTDRDDSHILQKSQRMLPIRLLIKTTIWVKAQKKVV